MRPLHIGLEKATQKIKYYCAYQERSHKEVRDKLYSFGLYKNEVEQLVADMVEADYLNEERFATAFAGGKFRMKGWGKMKIKAELKNRGVSEYCIKIGLARIDTVSYAASLEKLFNTRLQALKTEKNIFIKKRKVQQFLLQRGFEPALINAWINKI
ncbi:MAG: hypothetical protein ABS68_07905 [Niastella sp. SCN 39-18]|nr:RecX family transcriptional regulator [Sphingobacteriales bacterium]ODT52502.1 MAG: hypothetical protein ABS68_07905 [Niastella sp. SCN 39-18]OJW11642.1 MAG: hypothetical protein BGO53_11975 [Sphingobacteriales bacterium 39-19]